MTADMLTSKIRNDCLTSHRRGRGILCDASCPTIKTVAAGALEAIKCSKT